MDTAQQQTANLIEKALTAISTNWTDLLVALVGVGIVTMALLQLVKDLLPTRRWYQQFWLRYFWLYEHAAEHQIERPAADVAMGQLIDLATAGDAKALFNLPVEQLTGQLNAAAQALLDRPARQYENLLYIFAHRADPEDVEAILKKRPTETAALNRYLESRNRVSQQIQRSLDAMQISMGYRWQWILQGLSVLISAGFIFAALEFYGGGAFRSPDRIAYELLVSVLGGFIAPVARDLVAALQSLRGRVR